MTYGSTFSRFYRSSRWEASRISIAQQGMGRLIRFGLGRRKPVYRARDEATGELSDEASEEERVVMDVEGARKMMRDYWWLLAEMVVVSVGAAGAFGAALWMAGRAACRLLL